MNYLLEAFGELSFATVIIYVAAIVFIIKLCICGYEKLTKIHDRRQEQEELIYHVRDSLDSIKQDQFELKKTVEGLLENQMDIKARQDKFEEEHTRYLLASTRDKLLASYRYYTDPSRNPKLAWTEMEKEVFDNLFESYSNMGGNGSMHKEVEPAMLKLTVIPISDTKAVEDLNKSRG